VFGQKQVKIKVTLNGEDYKTNFENKDISISLPIFTIHGNHDYPNEDFGKISVCDLLHANDYVNYFGRQRNLHSMVIRPLIITKLGSTTQIALYGLGYVKDDILRELF
jgi:double-strand break repair protein MRE11